MGLKGYRLWAMGQLDSNLQSPTEAHLQRVRRHGHAPADRRGLGTGGLCPSNMSFWVLWRYFGYFGGILGTFTSIGACNVGYLGGIFGYFRKHRSM
jgi:hypothetical protein